MVLRLPSSLWSPRLSQLCLLLLLVSLSLPRSALSAFLGCPDDYVVTAEDTKKQLELEEYFVGHAQLPFFKPIDQFLDDTSASLGLVSPRPACWCLSAFVSILIEFRFVHVSSCSVLRGVMYVL